MNLFQAIFNQDALQRTAIIYEQRQISYAELRKQTLAVGGVLRALEIQPGDRVALLLNDSPEFIASFIAICSYGAIAVPINMGLRLREQRAILNDCAASLAIMEEDLFTRLLAGLPDKLAQLKQLVVVERAENRNALLASSQYATREQSGADSPAPWEGLGEGAQPESHKPSPRPLPKGEGEIENHEGGAIRIWSYEDLIRQSATHLGPVNQSPGLSAPWLSEAALAELFPEPRDDQPALILYTSGSTGEPKGAVHRQSDIFYTNETYCREVLALREGDRLFSSSRLPFAYGLGNSFTFPLLNGCTTILCREKPTPEVIAKVFADYQPTIFFAVPVVYRLLLDQARKQDAGSLSPSPFGGGLGRGHVLASSSAPSPSPSQEEGNKNPRLDCSRLRLCVSAGEALPAQLGEEWEATLGVPILDGIGSTEMLHMWMSNHEGEILYGSSGKLLEGYEARLLDPEGRPTPAGVEGNLWVRGVSAAIGYWQRRETTAGTFVDGWVRTGDLYRQDANGFWFHMGRSDDCFKSSGQWVSPVEVEGVLLRHQSVRSAAVVEDFDSDGLPCACAFVVRADASLDELTCEQGMRELARASLPRFKQPRRYVFVDELPYTATGKIQRFKLRKTVQSPCLKSKVQSLSSASNE